MPLVWICAMGLAALSLRGIPVKWAQTFLLVVLFQGTQRHSRNLSWMPDCVFISVCVGVPWSPVGWNSQISWWISQAKAAWGGVSIERRHLYSTCTHLLYLLSGKCHQGSKMKASCLTVLSWSYRPGFCYRQCSMWFQGDALVPGLYWQQCPQMVMAVGSALPGQAVFLISGYLWPRDTDCSLENLFGVMAPLPWQMQWVMGVPSKPNSSWRTQEPLCSWVSLSLTWLAGCLLYSKRAEQTRKWALLKGSA